MPGLSSIEGISSGLNITEIVDAIMTYERRNVVLLQQEQAEKTNIVSVLKALQAKFLALNTELARMSKVSTFEAAKVTVSDEDVLRATMTGGGESGAYDIQVSSLARNHQIASQGFSNESLSAFGTGAINIKVGDGSIRTITIDATNNTLVGIKKAINDAQAGVTASIVNDGSSSKPYRLVLSANETGIANKMTVTSNLSGGNNLNFSSASFDSPEVIDKDPGSTATVSLGATASFTGSQNKVYTFTVGGAGTQTVGSGAITINWTDGTNSGSINVTQVGAEVALSGSGADGLKLAFSGGSLTSGDVFQVSTFAPTLQEASDARIAIGSTGGSGSPIIVTSSTNTFSDLFGGLSITLLKETAAGQSVSVSTNVDITAVKNAISAFIERFNEVNDFINKQNTYNKETKESGVLFGDSTLQMMQNSLRSVLSSRVSGLQGKYTSLLAVGIHTTASGTLEIVNSGRLETALNENLGEVIRLFTSSGSSSSNFIEFVSSTTTTKPGKDYVVDITQAATGGRLQGSGIADPAVTPLTLSSSSNRLKLVVDGLTSNEIVLTEKTYTSTDQLVQEIQGKIDADAGIGGRGLTVTWVDSGSGMGYLNFTSSTYGSSSKVQAVTSIANNAYGVLGLAAGASLAGTDVAGTINGEAAEGRGQFLTGKDGNRTTAGLKLRVTLDPSQVGDGSEGTISVTKGLAARMADVVGSFTKVKDGLFDRKTAAVQNQVSTLQERIDDFEERLTMRRDSLLKKFYAMESALGQLNAQSQYLTNQLAGISSNWLSNKR